MAPPRRSSTSNNDFGQVYSDAFEELAGENNIEIVDTQTIEAPETAPPTAQIASIAGNAPDVIMAAPLGAQCATFASELVNAKAANPDWEPRVYITNTCASPLILGVAGAAADGLITSSNQGLKDIGNAEVAQADPEIVTYIDYMTGAGRGRHDPDQRRRLDGWRGDGGHPRPGRRVAGRLDASVDHQRRSQLRVHPRRWVATASPTG